jgi:iron(II)-dependent oxidoreductase
MAGNIWEWTRSLWGKNLREPDFKYPYHFDDERENESAGSSVYRVLRGGSFLNDGERARCAYRHRNLPDRGDGLNEGFRVAVSLVDRLKSY